MGLFDILGQALSGGQQAGNPFGFTQPTGSGLSAYNPNPAPMIPQHNSGILQSTLGDPGMAAQSPMGGGIGLASILMRLGLMHQ